MHAREVERVALYHKFKVTGPGNPLVFSHKKYKNTKVLKHKYKCTKIQKHKLKVKGLKNPLVCSQKASNSEPF